MCRNVHKALAERHFDSLVMKSVCSVPHSVQNNRWEINIDGKEWKLWQTCIFHMEFQNARVVNEEKKMWSFPPSAHSNWYEMNIVEMIEKIWQKALVFLTWKFPNAQYARWIECILMKITSNVMTIIIFYIVSLQPEGHYQYSKRTRRALSLYSVYGKSALLVLKGTITE